MKILIVDDDKFNLTLARDIIEANVENGGIIVCNTPNIVPDILAKESVGVILLDIVMPGINGIDLLKYIRGRDDFNDIQIIMFTGISDEESLRVCFENGANDFINKPINQTELIARVRAAIKVRQYILELKETSHKMGEQYNDLQAMTRKLQETQSSLIQTEKLASLGEIAAGVAHEINNPIGFVSSNLETLEKYLVKIRQLLVEYRAFGTQVIDETILRSALVDAQRNIVEFEQNNKMEMMLDDFGPLVKETREGVERVAKIVQSLRTFARTGREDEMALNDLNQIVEESLLIMQNEIKYVAHVNKKLGELPRVKCDKSQIAQVFVNILSNAAQAIKSLNREAMGNIGVETYVEGDFAICRISDDGPGIKEEYIGRIFDPFFTTKPVGSGTGLGLSIAYGLIKKHGGDFQVESEWGKGAAFTVKLPGSD